MSKYTGKKILLASMHNKEVAITPAFSEIVGCEIVVAEKLDTDQFGTFSGEIPREISAYETLKKKAVFAAEVYGADYVISSEGSFGPHPNHPFINADIEMLLFYDKPRDLFIADYEISTETNHAELEISKEDTLSEKYTKWLEKVNFPSHGLIVRSESTIIQKGICSPITLKNTINDSFRKYPRLKLETDMRAMMNPSRMKVINTLASKLAKRVASTCTQCGTPGFPNIVKSGHLRCELCFQETKIAKFLDLKCLKCDYLEQKEINPEEAFANPQYCDYCNP